jgi:hypothetical protein
MSPAAADALGAATAFVLTAILVAFFWWLSRATKPDPHDLVAFRGGRVYDPTVEPPLADETRVPDQVLDDATQPAPEATLGATFTRYVMDPPPGFEPNPIYDRLLAELLAAEQAEAEEAEYAAKWEEEEDAAEEIELRELAELAELAEAEAEELGL